MTQQGDIGSGVGFTALAAAAGRAVETSRPDRLIDDPLASAFVAASDSPVPLPVRWPAPDAVLSDREALLLHGSGYVGLRSRFCDDQLRRDGVGQVVVLAAGLDTRAFRLDWPAGTRLFEIEQPSVLHFKDTVLRAQGAVPRCARTTVGVDLRGDWADALTTAGFDVHRPAIWLAEGLLQYLPADAERALFEQVDALSAPGSHLVVERSANLARLAAGEHDRLREIGERTGIAMDRLVDPGARPDPGLWLAEHGWTVTEHPVTEIAEHYRRDLADPRLPRSAPTSAPGPSAPGPSVSTSFLCARR
jgi:methyltransferase (TIGR00027 family)